MNPSSPNFSEEQATYTLDIVAELTGVSSQTILHYQEQGLLHSAGEFDDETIHALRRIEHLRNTSEANLIGIKLILDLLDEVDSLKAALRAQR